jgi:hypothetical protein
MIIKIEEICNVCNGEGIIRKENFYNLEGVCRCCGGKGWLVSNRLRVVIEEDKPKVKS